MKPTLKLASSDNSTPEDIYRARIDRSHREWKGPTNRPWTPYAGPTGKSKSDVDAALATQWRIVPESKPPWWWRILRRLRGVK